ncbi:MAG: hypothetical protein KGJ13_09115 [Patescibacteria group bacterium]|nr:hypothetical protein [Patescibacteria group bacterium]
MKLKYKPGDICYLMEPLYKSPFYTIFFSDDHAATSGPWQWNGLRLSQLYMPRIFARTFVRIVSAKVERLQDISEWDAGKEGVTLTADQQAQWVSAESRETFNRHAFRLLWDSINAKREGGKYAWARNPWVVCYEWELLK